MGFNSGFKGLKHVSSVEMIFCWFVTTSNSLFRYKRMLRIVEYNFAKFPRDTATGLLTATVKKNENITNYFRYVLPLWEIVRLRHLDAFAKLLKNDY